MLPPGPRVPFPIQLGLWVRDPFRLLDACAARYGHTFTLRLRPDGPAIITAHPDAVRQIFALGSEALRTTRQPAFSGLVGPSSLLLLSGAAHGRLRRVVLPALTGPLLQRASLVARQRAEAAVASWPLRRSFRAYDAVRDLVLDVLLDTFLTLPPADRAALARCLRTGVALADRPLLLVALHFARLLRCSGTWSAVLRLVAEADHILVRAISRRRAEGGGGDLLGALCAARDEHGAPLSDSELRDQLWTLLLSAFDTTIGTLCWTLYHVLADPGLQERLRGELEGAAAVARLPLLDATLREAMRLRPALPDVRRIVRQPLRLLDYQLPAGAEVAPSIYLAQRRAEVYLDPDRFRPERFLEGQPALEAWFPFGAGVRRCVGAELALGLMRAILGAVLGRAELRLMPGPSPRPLRRFFAVVPAGGVPIMLVSRRGAAAVRTSAG